MSYIRNVGSCPDVVDCRKIYTTQTLCRKAVVKYNLVKWKSTRTGAFGGSLRYNEKSHLPAFYLRCSHCADHTGFLAEALVAPAPARISANTDSWRERPPYTSRRRLSRRRRRNFPYDVWIPSGAQPNVMGEYGRAQQVVVPVNCVDSIQDWNSEACEGCF